MEKRGLLIRYLMGKFYLCDGEPPKGCENDGNFYVGNVVAVFETWEEAEAIRAMIDTAYGFKRGIYFSVPCSHYRRKEEN